MGSVGGGGGGARGGKRRLEWCAFFNTTRRNVLTRVTGMVQMNGTGHHGTNQD